MEDISLAERQVVEIARAITQDAKILFLDEPTSSLVEREVEWLFSRFAGSARGGTSIVFTSHRWHEIRNIADRITVFRAGREVGTYTELDEDHAVTLMTDRRVDALYPARSLLVAPTPTLEVKELMGAGVSGVSLTLHKGEILGVGGLAGHGHRELFFMLFGAARAAGGTVTLNGKPVRLRRPRAAIRAGIALVPEDRKAEGLLLSDRHPREPHSIGAAPRLALWRDRQAAGAGTLCRQMVDRLRIRSGGLGAPVGTLSGGNQQKVLLGRWLLTDCQILLLYDVTRGVDVATKHEIYDLMMRLAGQGKAILFYSSEAEELAHLAHRVLVLREGRVARGAERRGAHRRADRRGFGARSSCRLKRSPTAPPPSRDRAGARSRTG